ncbi:class I SAM-dependent methyltransferase [Nocardia sp. NPDC057440]|uniref:class I SAM-dependent methyltransferase n=1 Tax=Nocardia sp. NPDC057440 TaxID=3346134 RepID=UPI00366E7ABF
MTANEPASYQSVTAASGARYSNPTYLATYLRAEWDDLLSPPSLTPPEEPAVLTADALDDQSRPGRFYRRAGAIVERWCSELAMDPERICDIGGSTGRMGLELRTQFPQAGEILIVEPSAEFCEWSERLLKGPTLDLQIPVPQSVGRVNYRPAPEDWSPIAASNIQILNGTAESVPTGRARFDVITCLNVVDRVVDPVGLIKEIKRLIRPGGLFVLASPLHFDSQFTPRELWVEDLRELLNPADWRVDDRVTDVRYNFFHYSRRLSCYLSQVVGAIRNGDEDE